MRFLPILLFLCLDAYSQACQEFSSLTKDKTGQDMYTFNKYIAIEDGPRKFVVYGFIWERSIALVIEVKAPHTCYGTTSSLIVKFSDGSKIEMENILTNCDRQLVVHLDKDDERLKLLRTKEIKLMNAMVLKKNLVSEISVSRDVADELLKSIDCLSTFLSDSPTQERSTSTPSATPDSLGIYTVVEHQPEFFGGDQAMSDYLRANLRFAKDAGGKVTVSFIIDREGNIRDASIIEPNSREVNAEVLRVVRSMPRWKPGLQNGKPVSVKYILPVTVR